MRFDTMSLRIFHGGRSALLFGALSVALVSCASSPSPKVTLVKKAKPTEYFAETDVGVKASPRVVNLAVATLPGKNFKRLPRGGGRDMVGKPYKIRGKWYTPREDQDYKATGTASWYGDAFHGRLTANGEIYDMNHLSAAHPTMPLPSYARVTNLKNGKSVIVRVNDRGPYAHNRLIDLSKRAAQLLDYTQSGTAQVQLEYVGRAPVDGADDEYLMASYRDAGQSPVMVAMNDPVATETPALAGVAYAPDTANPVQILGAPQAIAGQNAADGVVIEDTAIRGALPTAAPVVTDRPEICVTLEPCEGASADGLLSGYAPVKAGWRKTQAFEALGVEDGKSGNWKQDGSNERVLLGSYKPSETNGLKAQLRGLAKLTFEANGDSTVEVYARPVAGLSMDNLVRKLWKKGFSDAFVVR